MSVTKCFNTPPQSALQLVQALPTAQSVRQCTCVRDRRRAPSQLSGSLLFDLIGACFVAALPPSTPLPDCPSGALAMCADAAASGTDRRCARCSRSALGLRDGRVEISWPPMIHVDRKLPFGHLADAVMANKVACISRKQTFGLCGIWEFT